MSANIQNAQDLKARIAILKLKKAEDEIYFNQSIAAFKEILNSPVVFVKRILTFLGFRDDAKQPSKRADWVTNIGRVAFPYILNSTILRGRGFFLKTLVSLLSQKTINSMSFNKETLSSWVDKATKLISSTTKKKKNKKDHDYGIPPESETY